MRNHRFTTFDQLPLYIKGGRTPSPEAQRVREIMADGKPRTSGEIMALTGYPYKKIRYVLRQFDQIRGGLYQIRKTETTKGAKP